MYTYQSRYTHKYRIDISYTHKNIITFFLKVDIATLTIFGVVVSQMFHTVDLVNVSWNKSDVKSKNAF